ncbi:hypothetical protein M446_6326 [Methylobacterium sp. 4-46]|uniref:hypothetical protein n=1 Tax=unclassified Methylobacterium TaxID=2615210 RepID=UPI000165CBEB|nr:MULTISPECIES: hypothetical protein [Methylobacterium]ACA20591.1 hypothetical protein M446_6326 [Methylobacterium sp. 4-46]WFT79755.1 hypothetical protein QA634_31950 [Methylobacterium nodulans]
MTAPLLHDPALLERPGARRGAARAGGRRAAPAPAAPRMALVADFLAIAALDPAVETLRAGPAPARLLLGDEAVAHAADFEVSRTDEPGLLVDVVAEADLARHPLRTAYVAGEPVWAEDGRRFVIESAATVRAEPRLSTVRLVMACRRSFVSAGDRVRILHYLDECGTGRLVDCAGVVQNAVDGVAAVLALAVEGLVAIDIARPILPETPVRRRPLPFADPFGF